MKNLSLGLSITSLIAVIVLYIIQFSPKKGEMASSENATPSNLKVAFINSDTVLKYYDYFKMTKDKLESKGKKLDQDLQARAQSLQNDISAYQRNLGSMTIGQAKAVEEDLGKKQQNLRLYQQSLEQELVNEQAKINNELYGKVTDYLKKYGSENGLEVVLKYDPSSDLLYGSGALDITQQVIKGLNESYKAEASTVKSDSTAKKK
jgi:Outer membrane protein